MFKFVRFLSIKLILVLVTIQASAMEINGLERWTQELINQLYTRYHAEEVYIGGGSARAFLEKIFEDKPLKFRDFDLVVNMNRKVTYGLAAKMGEELQSGVVGAFLQHELRPRPRTNPKDPTDLNYNAGYGFFFKGSKDILDLTLMHSHEDVRLNGVLNIDRLRVLLPKGVKISELSEAIQKLGYAGAVKEGLIDDPDKGYLAWIEQKLKILDMTQLLRDPLNITIRIIRGAAKIDALPLDKKSKKEITFAIKNTPNELNQFQGLRNLIKLLEDPSAIKELQELYELGLLEKLILDTNKLLRMSQKELSEAKSYAYSSNPGFNVLAHALNQTPPQMIKGILRNLFLIEPKGTLMLISELNQRFYSNPLKVGYFTGEFAPFHRGHRNVVKTALESGLVDFVFVIPTPHATNSPKTINFSVPEWQERILFSELGLEDLNQAVVFPSKRILKLSENSTLASVLKKLQSMLGSMTSLTHIMGGDSLSRVIDRRLLTNDPRPRLVVNRLGVPKHQDLVEGHDVTFLPGLKYQVSATMILHQLGLDLIPKDLSKKVLAVVKGTERYKKIIEKYQDLRKKLKELTLTDAEKAKLKTLLIHSSFNYDGIYYESLSRPPKNLLAFAKKAINEEPALKTIFILMPYNKPVSREWIKFKNDLSENFPDKKIRFIDATILLPDHRVELWHAGHINGVLVHFDYYYEQLKSGVKYILYEGSGVHVSPLLVGLDKVQVYKERDLKTKSNPTGSKKINTSKKKLIPTPRSSHWGRSCVGFLN